MRAVTATATILVTLATMAGAASAAPDGGSKTEVISFPAEDLSEFFQERCDRGAELTAIQTGWVQIRTMPSGKGSRQQIEQLVFHSSIVFTNSATGASTTLIDGGPDRAYTVSGTTYFAQSGRAITGEGAIGRSIILAETGEVVSQNGNLSYCSKLP